MLVKLSIDEVVEEFKLFNEYDSCLIRKMREIWITRVRNESTNYIANIIATKIGKGYKSSKDEKLKKQ